MARIRKFQNPLPYIPLSVGFPDRSKVTMVLMLVIEARPRHAVINR